MLEAGASAEDIHAAVAELLSRPGARDAARSLVPENGARAAAAELMRLVCTPARVDRVEAALEDECLAAAVRTRTRPRTSRDVTHADATVRAASGIDDRDKHELEVLALAARLAQGRDDELALAVERASRLLAGRDAAERREVRGLVDAVARGLPSSSVLARAAACEATLAALDADDGVGGPLGPGDGAAARAAVADGRWGEAAAHGDTGEREPVSRDGVLLARAMRHAESSSSLRSSK